MRIFSLHRLLKSLPGLLLLVQGTSLWAQTTVEHFKPVRTQGIFRVARIDDAEILHGAVSYALEEGDEIGMFDGNLCVGANRVGSTPFPMSVSGILRYIAGDDTLSGADPSHNMMFRIWDASEQSELIVEAQGVSGGTFADDYTQITKLESHVARVTITADPDLPFDYCIDYGHTIDTLSTSTQNTFFTTQDTTLRFWFVPYQVSATTAGNRYAFVNFGATTLHVSGDVVDYHVKTSDLNLTIEGVFKLQYQLAIDHGPVEDGFIIGDGWYDANPSNPATVHVQIQQNLYLDPNNSGRRWSFLGWSGEQSGSSLDFDVVMDQPHFYATSWQKEFKLTTAENPDEGGTVTPAPPEGWYNDGTSVPVTATPSSNWLFIGWAGDTGEQTGPSITVVMDTNKTAIAQFEAAKLITITTNPSGLPVLVDGVSYSASHTFQWREGTDHTLTVSDTINTVQGTRHIFTQWSDGGARSHIYTVPSVSETVTANFQTQHLVTLNTAWSSATGGGWYNQYDPVTFSIGALHVSTGVDARQTFTGWTGSGSGAYTGPDSVHTVASLTGPITETAGWKQQYFLTVANIPSEVPLTVVSGAGWKDAGSAVLSANGPYLDPINSTRRHRFDHYSGDASGTSPTVTILMNAPKSVTVHWAKQFLLTTTATPSVGGSITLTPPGNWIDANSSVQATAVPNTADDWRWTGWGGDLVGETEQTVTVVMDTSKTAEAIFYAGMLIKLKTNPPGLTVRVDQVAHQAPFTLAGLEGETYTISVDNIVDGGPGVRYVFDHWSDGGAREHTYTVPDGNDEVTAYYTTQYLVTLNTIPGTTASGGGWYPAGSPVTFDVSPTILMVETGQRKVFDGWIGNAYNGMDNPHTILAISAPVTETTVWKTQYYLTTGVSPVDGGSITPATPGAWCDSASVLNIDASPYTGYQWRGWDGDLDTLTSKPAFLKMDGPKSVIAQFKNEVAITVTTDPPGLTFWGDGALYTAPHEFTWVVGDTHVLEARDIINDGAATRYVFKEWSQGGELEQNYLVPEGGADLILRYNTEHKLTLVSGFSSVPTVGSGYYLNGTTAEFRITTKTLAQGDTTRHLFTGWIGQGNGSYTGPDSAASVIMNNPITESATWQTQYYLDVTTAHGSATGEGWYDEGSSASITVEPDTVAGIPGERFIFKDWTGIGNGAYTGSNRSATVTMNSPISQTANWTTQYRLTTAENPDEKGDITPEPGDYWYDVGTSVPISAVVFSGFVWHGFTINDSQTADSNNPINVIMNAPKTVTANFQDFVLVTVNASHPNARFTASGDEYTVPHTFTWVAGQSIHFVVDPVQVLGDTVRYTFDSLSDGYPREHTYIVPTSNTHRTINLSAEYWLAVDSDKDTPVGEGWYTEGAIATFSIDTLLVNSTQNTRDRFTGWTGDYEGETSPGSLLIDDPKTVTANWQRQHYLSVTAVAAANPQGGGWYDEGASATFSVTSPYTDPSIAGKRWVLVAWDGTGEGSFDHTENDGPAPAEVTVVMNNPITEVAGWKPQYQLNVTIAPVSGGTVTLEPAGGWYYTSDNVTLSAVANDGYRWSGWTGGLVASESTRTLTLTSAKNVTANFEDVFAIRVQTQPDGLTFWVDGADYDAAEEFGWVEGESHTLSAPSPQFLGGDQSARFVFSHWSDGGAQNHYYTVPSTAITVAAYYNQQFLLDVQSDHGTPYGGGWVTSGRDTTFGVSETTVTNGSKVKYVFRGWTSDDAGGYTGTSATHAVTLTNGITQIAHWDTLYALSYSVAPEGKGIVTATAEKGWVKRGQSVQLTAALVDPTTTPYRFMGWDGDTTASGEVLILPMKKAYNVTANYTLVTHKVTRSVQFVDPDGGIHSDLGGTITASPNSTNYNHRSKVVFTAIPAEGMKFMEWRGGLSGTGTEQTVYILDTLNFTATFVYSDTKAPTATSYPLEGSDDVPVNGNVHVTVKDDIYGVNRATLDVTVGGVAIVNDGQALSSAVTVRQVTLGYEVIYSPVTSFAASSTVNIAVSCSDRATPANAMADALSFKTGPSSLSDPEEDDLPPSGGGITLPDGVILTVPDGAIADTTLILGAEALNAPAIPESLGKNHLGLVYYFGPDGMTFDSPVTIRLPFDPDLLAQLGIKTASVIKVYAYSTFTGEWTEVTPIFVDRINGYVTFEVSHFSYFRIVAVTPNVEPGEIINYPNPFDPRAVTTTIKYMLDEDADVTLKIYDVSSQLVTTLGEPKTARTANVEYTVEWDGRNDQGDIVANNVYFCVLSRSSGKAMIRKIVVLR